MKKRILQLVSAFLIAALLLTGCAGSFQDGLFRFMAMLGIGGVVPYERMTYTRPDLTAYQESLYRCSALVSEGDVKALMNEVWIFFGLYHDFYTNYALADIRYCRDITDLYWDAEYAYCLDASTEVDAGIDRLLNSLAASPLKEQLESEEYFGPGYFDAYTGQSIWDETFTQMAETEADLIEQYYDLCEEASGMDLHSDAYYDAFAEPIIELLAELVLLRQEMAAYAGYEDFPTFSYDFHFGRDYTPKEAEAYLLSVSEILAPLFRQIPDSVWDPARKAATTAQTYDYVRQLAQNAGGTIQSAFVLMDSAGLYDIAPGQNKYNASFEVFLPTYYEPFIFMNPTGGNLDKLTFAHEFGHFCNDYASGGSSVGIDVAEIFSQAMEYMSIARTDAGKELEQVKLADSLCVYVEQSTYASFEHQLYRLSEEELTVEGILDLYATTVRAFSFDHRDWDAREFISMTHLFTNPMYILSYVVSNDTAMQLYQLELKTPDAGLNLLQQQLSTGEYSLLAFLNSAGLESPFAEGRLEQVAQTMKDAGLAG